MNAVHFSNEHTPWLQPLPWYTFHYAILDDLELEDGLRDTSHVQIYSIPPKSKQKPKKN